MALIEQAIPTSWRDLQEGVALILRECGMNADTDVPVVTARGMVNMDVVATDLVDVHRARVFVECKYWTKRVPQTVVHAFRTVVGDAGAHIGVIVAKAGFQRGAVAAAASTNVRLLSWHGFQELYFDRWYAHYFRTCVDGASEALAEYTEPLNGRVARAERELNEVQTTQYAGLVRRYWGVALFAGSSGNPVAAITA